MKLDGKRALVTGAGRGIGKGCAIALARHGADLILNDRPGSPDLEATAAEIQGLGRHCTSHPQDVFSRDGCERLVRDAVDASGRIDILVHNPAYGRRVPFLEADPELFERVIAATLTSGFHMSQLVARHMVETSVEGKIVFISSVHAHTPFVLSAPYNAAKAGLNHLARTIAAELVEHRIRVNVIEPGWIDTPGERETFGDDRVDSGGDGLPWGRLGRPVEIGNAAAFLVSDDADYVTGSILRVDGGYVLRARV